MSTLKALCMRCPDPDSATMCSSSVNKPETLAKCQADGTTETLWPGFTNDTESIPSKLLPDSQKCHYFVVELYKQNNTFISKLKKKQAFEEQLKALLESKSYAKFDIDGVSVPVTKQMLEYAYSLCFAGDSGGERKEKKIPAAAKVPSPSTAGSSTVPPTSSPADSKATSVQRDPPEVAQPMSSVAQSVVQESLAGLSDLNITPETPSNKKPSASIAGEESPPFGKHLKSNTTVAQFGVTQGDKLGVQPAWKLSGPPQYHKSSAPPPYNKIIHSGALLDPLSDKIDKERTGIGGKPIQIITNYLRVTKVPKQVYEYSLVFGPFTQETRDDGTSRSVTQRSQKEQIFKALRHMDPLYGNDDWATDYVTIWSVRPLQNPSSSGLREPVTGERFTTQRVDFHKFSGKPSKIAGVTFSFTRKLEFPSESKALVCSGETDEKGAPIHVTALNALLSSKVAATDSIISTGPNKFYAKDDYKGFLGIQAHRGYFTSIRPGTQDILLNVSTMTGAFYQPVKVSDFMLATRGPKLNEYGHTESSRCEKLLVGRSVRILYDRASHDTTYNANVDANRHRVIVEIGMNPSLQMFGEGKDRMSVRQYFVNKLHACPAPSDDFLCVNVGVKFKKETRGKQIWIPADFVSLDPNQPFSRRLASPHMVGIHSVSLLPPAATQDKIIKNGFDLLELHGNTFDQLDIKIVPKLLLIPARSLQDPKLLYRDPKGKTKTVQPRSASWNLLGSHFLLPATVHTSISTLDFRSTLLGGDQNNLARTITDAMAAAGMKVPAPATEVRSPAPPYWWSGDVQSGRSLAKDFTDKELAVIAKPFQNNPGPALHVVILQDTDSESYATIKRVFDQYVGSHTVCITAAKLPRPGDVRGAQLLGNMSLKFNLKLGGINHLPTGVDNAPAFNILGKDTMVVGADVSHAPSQMRHCPSVAAVVASENHNFANFPGSMRLQASKQEFLQDLSGMMVERLLRYGVLNRQLPKKIIFFRDGVGEDMYDRVRDEEITQINNAYEQIRTGVDGLKSSKRLPPDFRAGEVKLQLTFIIVGKRHNTRFFCKTADQGDKNGNVSPGLIVDRVIARPKLNQDDQTFDFFLQSHQALKGTARSGHYVVLQKGAFDVTQIQGFTHAFCFNYARATKGVSYAAPAYYADRLAERGTLYLKAYTNERSVPDISMSDREEAIPDKRAAEREYERRVAQHVQDSQAWNPRVNAPLAGGAVRRINPWHTWMDNSMFWL